MILLFVKYSIWNTIFLKKYYIASNLLKPIGKTMEKLKRGRKSTGLPRKTAPVLFRVVPTLKEKLVSIASKENRSITNVLETFIASYPI